MYICENKGADLAIPVVNDSYLCLKECFYACVYEWSGRLVSVNDGADLAIPEIDDSNLCFKECFIVCL